MGTDVQDGLNGYNSCSLVDEMDTLSLFEPAQRPTHPSSSSTTNIPDEVLTRESFYVLGDENLSDALLEEGWSAVTDPYHRLAMFKRTLKVPHRRFSEASEASTIIGSQADLMEGGDVEISSASQKVSNKHANPNGEMRREAGGPIRKRSYSKIIINYTRRTGQEAKRRRKRMMRWQFALQV